MISLLYFPPNICFLIKFNTPILNFYALCLLGPKVYGAMLIVKQFKPQKCGHEKNPISAADCLYSMVKDGNMNHYFIATQDPALNQEVSHVYLLKMIQNIYVMCYKMCTVCQNCMRVLVYNSAYTLKITIIMYQNEAQ